MSNECHECKFYCDETIPSTVGCGECRRFPPTATITYGQQYAMGRYPVISRCNPTCYEFMGKK